jgi:hypothetical protein
MPDRAMAGRRTGSKYQGDLVFALAEISQNRPESRSVPLRVWFACGLLF